MSILGFRSLRGETVALPPEIAFLLGHAVSPMLLAKAAALARASGTDAATALIQSGLIEEERFYRVLALTLGARFLGDALPLGAGARFPDSLIAGVAPLAPGMGAAFVYAPRGRAVVELLEGRSPTGLMPAITTPTALRRAIFAQRPAAIAAHASDELVRRRPDWAYNAAPAAPIIALASLLFGAVVLVAASLPALLMTAVWILVQVGFLALLTFRVAAIGPTSGVEPDRPPGQRLPDADLPVYTVFVALYREAAVVPRLLGALTQFDYPVTKLDIKLLTEADDGATAAALARLALPAHVDVVVVPPGLPKTKPRALNAALPLARGSCLVVYDAEDVPDPGQLRAAAEAFARASPRTACLQGRLVIDNARDSWLTRCFALEYTALFDVLGPALAAWRLPTPLGGTSTHFRTHILRAVHGWDAWNVTEDADLGLRLARAGYDVGDLPSSTIEEAPAHYKAWLNQRTRWMKGFLQTSLTHGRNPLVAVRELGPLASLCALALIPGTVASALAYPFLMLPALVSLWPSRIEAGTSFWSNLPTGAAITVLVSGFVAMLMPAYIGCRRRGWHDLIPFVPLLPVYFLLVSLAAWRGVIELVLAPDRWNKTEHGLSRTSRSGALKPRPPP
ncbi:glycosyltransferase family 2 protein [Methylobacterium sp. 77]|uniref:glycosyltransferase family 2 protein n=1 Tax=Methylobacterium sp. 77 TaxID=1101192 RepID=UPI00036DCC1C|nr:glycosyltransferase family 2 protein [Methylobacterium sp. 77]